MGVLFSNDPGFDGHPLKYLLLESVHIDKGGGWSDRFGAACKIPGWDHNFVRWDGMTSVEKLTWGSEETFQKLCALYAEFNTKS